MYSWCSGWSPNGAHLAGAADMFGRGTVRTIGLFIGVLAVLEGIYVFAAQSEPLIALEQTTAYATAWSLSMLKEAVHLEGTTIHGSDLTIQIVSECSAITPVMVFAAAVIAFPAPILYKLQGLLFGAVTLYTINLVRVVSLYYIAKHAPSQLEFVHLVVWQALIVVIAIGLWALWAGHHAFRRA